jgi:zinc metalloprotease ZmpA
LTIIALVLPAILVSVLPVSASSAFDFSLSNSGGFTAVQGGYGSTTISITLVSGTPQTVYLSCSGLPQDSVCTFNPAYGVPSAPTTASISALSSTPVGSYTITVTGTAGAVAHTTQFTFTVIRQSQSLGGTTVSVDKEAIVALYAGLATVVGAVAATTVYIKRTRTR